MCSLAASRTGALSDSRYACFHPAGEAVPKMLMKNFHNAPYDRATLRILGGSASFVSCGMSTRLIDGLRVDAYARDMTDPYFSVRLHFLDAH